MMMPPEGENSGVLQVREMSRGFCLRKFKNFFKIRDAHFFIFEDEMQYSQPGLIGTGFKNLGAQRQIETF